VIRLLAFTSRYLTPPGPHRLIYRLTGGRIGHRAPGIRPRMLLLTARGRRSGVPRTTPLMYFEIDDRIVVAATNNGRDRDPAWAGNLQANPEASVQVGSRTMRVRAREAEGEERQHLWAVMTAEHPLFALYEQRTARRIPVVVLDTEAAE
jgi:deazaflavin-dependent oxidoreductase (nitroreductase family)